MFKVISAELKKIVSKPGIYILAILLAVILVLGVFIYKPTVYENTNYTLAGNTFMEKYTNYSVDGRKKEADAYISTTSNIINMYYIDDNNYKTTINNQIDEFNQSYKNYKDCMYTDASEITINNLKNNLIESLEKLNSTIFTGLENNKQGCYAIVTTEKNYKTYSSTYSNILALFKTNSDIESVCNEYKNKYQDSFKDCLNKFYYPTLSNEIIDN